MQKWVQKGEDHVDKRLVGVWDSQNCAFCIMLEVYEQSKNYKSDYYADELGFTLLN